MAILPKKWPSRFPYASWYLDALAGQWEYLKVDDKQGDKLGILPYRVKKRFGLRLLTPPPLSPRLGPHIFYPPGLSLQQKRALEWKVLTELAQKLPKVHDAKINWPYELTNGLPWQQQGWTQMVRYSYVLDLSQTIETIRQGFKPSLRNKIRKADKLLKVTSSQDWRIPFELTQKVFQYRKVREQLSSSLMEKLDVAAATYQSRTIFVATDERGQNHAALWLFFDENSSYNLLLGSDPALRSSGAPSLLLWHAIQYSKEKGLKTFDFEGSHLPGVESFFRSFGGETKPYYQFTKTVKWLKIVKAFL